MTLDDLCLKQTHFPTLVLPCAKDQATNHVFCVIDDLIFDSTQKCALKLCRESIDWICGEEGCDSILVAYCFNQTVKAGLVYKRRHVVIHWTH